VSDPTGPSTSEPVPIPAPAAAEPPAAQSPNPAPNAIAAMDPASVRIAGAGVAVAVIAVIGAALSTWTFDWSAIVLIAAGLLAAGTAMFTWADRPRPIARRDLILTGGEIAGVLGVLFLAEVLADLDGLDDYGGVIGAVAALALAAAGVVLYLLATNAWSGGPIAPWTRALAAGDRSTKLVMGGGVLAVVGWLGNVTIGVWYLDPGVIAITAILLAALVVRAAADTEQPLVLPFPAAYLTVALTAIAALLAIQHTIRLADQDVGIGSWIPQLLYVAGVAIALIGAVLGAMASMRRPSAAPDPGDTAAG
jgi:hypothetical protein